MDLYTYGEEYHPIIVLVDSPNKIWILYHVYFSLAINIHLWQVDDVLLFYYPIVLFFTLYSTGGLFPFRSISRRPLQLPHLHDIACDQDHIRAEPREDLRVEDSL